MSDEAVAQFTEKGWNKDYAFNQVVYLEALERAKNNLSVKDNQIVCNLKSGAEIKIAKDLFYYILGVFSDWNLSIKEGKYKIIEIESGGYNVLPTVND